MYEKQHRFPPKRTVEAGIMLIWWSRDEAFTTFEIILLLEYSCLWLKYININILGGGKKNEKCSTQPNICISFKFLIKWKKIKEKQSFIHSGTFEQENLFPWKQIIHKLTFTSSNFLLLHLYSFVFQATNTGSPQKGNSAVEITWSTLLKNTTHHKCVYILYSLYTCAEC